MRCTCPAGGKCRHVLVATMHLQQLSVPSSLVQTQSDLSTETTTSAKAGIACADRGRTLKMGGPQNAERSDAVGRRLQRHRHYRAERHHGSLPVIEHRMPVLSGNGPGGSGDQRAIQAARAFHGGSGPGVSAPAWNGAPNRTAFRPLPKHRFPTDKGGNPAVYEPIAGGDGNRRDCTCFWIGAPTACRH